MNRSTTIERATKLPFVPPTFSAVLIHAARRRIENEHPHETTVLLRAPINRRHEADSRAARILITWPSDVDGPPSTRLISQQEHAQWLLDNDLPNTEAHLGPYLDIETQRGTIASW